MRIAYLINGLNGGGAAFPMVQVIGLMREFGHEATVLALMPQDGKAAPRLERAGIPYEVIGAGAGDFVLPALRLIRRLRSFRPDVLWTSLTRGTIYGQLVGRLLSIPVVSWQHNAVLKPANLAVLRRTRALTWRWVADSEAVRHFTQQRLGVDPGRIDVWSPFVADPALPTAAPWPGLGPIRLGSLGRLHHSKQYAVLLRAFARARELDPVASGRCELHIAGDGDDRPALESLAARLGLGSSVRFVGFVEQPSAFLARLHGYAQTSLKEGFCIAAHEAMQAGLPVVATRTGELAHSVRPGETGWLCEVGDTEGIATALLALAADPARSAGMGRTARAWLLERHALDRFRATGLRLLDDIRQGIGEPARRHDKHDPARAAPGTRGESRDGDPKR